MRRPKVCILRTAGTNCDWETKLAFELAGAAPELIHINEFISKRKKFNKYDILALPGGFSYGDDISAGKILANELVYKLFDELTKFAYAKKPIIGICNGFQVLVKAGLLPESDGQKVTLTYNDSGKFECRWVYLKVVHRSQGIGHSLWIRDLPEIIQLPVAHAEGKFVTKNKNILNRLQKNNQIVFKYVDEKGNEDIGYPYNPNGSEENIAGICNPEGNILGMMPHPERYITAYQYPCWTSSEQSGEGIGLQIFKNAVKYVQ